MQSIASDQIDRMRYLECWLPLAQQLAEEWGLEQHSLQELLLARTAALANVTNGAEACIALYRLFEQEMAQ